MEGRSSRQRILPKMHPKPGRHPCPTPLRSKWGGISGRPRRLQQTASPIVPEFRRTVPTVTPRTVATSNISIFPTLASSTAHAFTAFPNCRASRSPATFAACRFPTLAARGTPLINRDRESTGNPSPAGLQVPDFPGCSSRILAHSHTFSGRVALDGTRHSQIHWGARSIFLISWGRLLRRSFAPTATSILVRFRSPCNCRIGASGCHAYIPRTPGDKRLHRANSLHSTMVRRLREAKTKLPRTRRCAHSWQRLRPRITTFVLSLPRSPSGLKCDVPSLSTLSKEKQCGRQR